MTVWRALPAGRRRTLWVAGTRAARFEVADDGRSLVAVQPWANLVEANAGPATTMLTFYRPNAAPVPVSLGEMIRDVPALPRTVSHRHWATMLGYDGRYYIVDTVEGRTIRFDPHSGRPVTR